MNTHQHARMTVHGRALLVNRILVDGWRVAEAAQSAGISERSAYKWLARFRTGGVGALRDRSSAPLRPTVRVTPAIRMQVEALRRTRLTGQAIAERLALPRSTVGRVLRGLGLGRLSALEVRPPVIRYQRERPGELIHIDTKKLGRIDGVGHRITGNRRDGRRGIGWEALHVAIDDASRLAYTAVLPDETKQSAITFMSEALAFFARHGVTVERVMSDNGSAYCSHAFRDLLAEAGLRHVRTRPYTPRTNGKAECFIQTSLREWIYAVPYASSADRTQAMSPWIDHYNTNRTHSALSRQTPWQRLNNLLGNDT
ncbi:IS481 family transposase [Methylobacterium flocculans]|uniref:IS481 family transposase n=1 Tax=Methylobacterium flocculans TaxID=2984843 RepID=UPI0021F2910D|nr:IS481 family transposase [Methylobacterium sp. FF17]